MSEALIWIPARGGSKRIVGKNLALAGGCSLLARTIWVARDWRRASGVDARIIVDTDSPLIAEEARSWGAEVPFLREAEYASDDATSADAALRLLERLGASGRTLPPVFLLFQPTSPLREIDHLMDCWDRFQDGRGRVISVRTADLEAGAAMTLAADGSLTRAESTASLGVVCPSGAFYAVSTEALMRDRAFHMDGESRGVLATGVSALDVDEPYQLELVDRWLRGPRRATDSCLIVAEAGVNHDGDPGRALEMVDAAADAGADAVKFQTFDPARLVARSAPKADYQVINTGSAGTQMEMLESLILPIDAYERLLERCNRRGIRFMSTPFHVEGAEFLVHLGVDAVKISSGEITNWPFLEHVGGLGVPVVLSTGMSTLPEVADAVEVVRMAGDANLTLLHCVSNYPARAEDANLRAMDTMAALFGVDVGWSDHTLGINIALGAVARGASVLEKHFTLDRTLPGPDHRASLEPGELEALVEGVREVERSLGDGVKAPAQSELSVAVVARRSLHAARDLTVGHPLTSEDLVSLRPGTGIPPSRLKSVLGRRLVADISEGDLLTEEFLG